jgi:predicted GNAT family N-acyltransferase
MKSILSCRIIQHFSAEYWETVKVRYAILRLPLKIDFSFSQLLAEDQDIHIAAFDEANAILGCLILTPLNQTQLRMRQVAVASAFQKMGVGKKLVEFSEKFAIENGYAEIVLHARATAIPFYLQLGYKTSDEPFEEVGIPHRKMRKYL